MPSLRPTGRSHDHSRLYTSWSPRSIPHRLRIRALTKLLSSLGLPTNPSYADLGSGNGWLTHQLSLSIGSSRTDAFDVTPVQLEDGRKQYPELRFHELNLNEPIPEDLHGAYDLVTCLETLEHIGRPSVAIQSVLKAMKPEATAVITVPIETGIIGTAKFLVKGCYGLILGDKKYFTAELRSGSETWWQYLRALVSGGDISAFRDSRDRWATHFGFDYRAVDRVLECAGRTYTRKRIGSSMFYVISGTDSSSKVSGSQRP